MKKRKQDNKSVQIGKNPTKDQKKQLEEINEADGIKINGNNAQSAKAGKLKSIIMAVVITGLTLSSAINKTEADEYNYNNSYNEPSAEQTYETDQTVNSDISTIDSVNIMIPSERPDRDYRGAETLFSTLPGALDRIKTKDDVSRRLGKLIGLFGANTTASIIAHEEAGHKRYALNQGWPASVKYTANGGVTRTKPDPDTTLDEIINFTTAGPNTIEAIGAEMSERAFRRGSSQASSALAQIIYNTSNTQYLNHTSDADQVSRGDDNYAYQELMKHKGKNIPVSEQMTRALITDVLNAQMLKAGFDIGKTFLHNENIGTKAPHIDAGQFMLSMPHFSYYRTAHGNTYGAEMYAKKGGNHFEGGIIMNEDVDRVRLHGEANYQLMHQARAGVEAALSAYGDESPGIKAVATLSKRIKNLQLELEYKYSSNDLFDQDVVYEGDQNNIQFNVGARF